MVLWLRSLDNLSTELWTLSRGYRKSTAASGHQEQIKGDQTAATSSSQNLLLISLSRGGDTQEALQLSDEAIKRVSGRHEGELPAASQRRAASVRLLTPQKHLNTPLNSSDWYTSYHTPLKVVLKCKCEDDMNPLMTTLEIHQRKLWRHVKAFFSVCANWSVPFQEEQWHLGATIWWIFMLMLPLHVDSRRKEER